MGFHIVSSDHSIPTRRHNMLDLLLLPPCRLCLPHLSFYSLMVCQCQVSTMINPLLHSLLQGPSENSRSSGAHCVVKPRVCEGRFGSISLWLACGGICHVAAEKNSSLPRFALHVFPRCVEVCVLPVHVADSARGEQPVPPRPLEPMCNNFKRLAYA